MAKTATEVVKQPAPANESAAAVADAQERRRQEMVTEAAESAGPANAIIPANAQPDFLMDMSTSGTALHNFTGSPMELFAKVNQATGPECVTGSKTLGVVVQLTHYYVHPVLIAPDDESDPVRVPRVVLFDKDGTAYAFCSQGIADSLNQLLQCLGGVIPPEGVPLTVTQIDTRKGNRTYSLVYSPDAKE